MITVKNLAATCAIAWGLTLYTANAAADVSPVVGSFGKLSLGPHSLEAYRTPQSGPWYVTFELDHGVDRYVTLRAEDWPATFENRYAFSVTGLNLYEIAEDGTTHIVAITHLDDNPDDNPGLYGATLSDGMYALAVSGYGNSTSYDFTDFPYTGGQWAPGIDSPDFRVDIQVAVIPEPEIYALMLAGLGLVGFAARQRLYRGAAC